MSERAVNPAKPPAPAIDGPRSLALVSHRPRTDRVVSAPAEADELAGLRAIVEGHGLDEAQRRTGLGRVTLMRALALLPVSAGTRAAIREAVRPRREAVST